MRYDKIPVELFIENRKRFISLMKENTIAIFSSNDIKHTNADDVMGFAQNNDLFYLSGIDQEDTIMMLYPDAHKKENKAILFIKEVTAYTKLWDGDILTKQQASLISVIERIEWVKDYEKILQLIAFESDGFYLGHNEHIKRVTYNQQTQQDRMIIWCKQKYPLHNYYRAAKLTRSLRVIKSELEIALIKRAIEISNIGFKRALKAIKPGMKEYEIEAEITYAAIKYGGQRNSFLPIVASGKNACSLHYNTNDSECESGDMILMDFGVCYANYNSDTTRCFPVSGTFSARQKEVYNAVLNCLKQGAKLLRPGILFSDYENEMINLVQHELIRLGLITQDEIDNQDPDNPVHKKYFMHGTAHHLGLDVHDVGLYSKTLEKGMVLTCEPGIYISEENIGCRLENNYLITDGDPINLSASLPIEIDEIEAIMLHDKINIVSNF